MRFPLLILSYAVAFVLLTGCNQEQKIPAVQEIAASSQPAIATVAPQYGTFSALISTTASIQPSPDGIVSISAPVTGTVDKLHVSIGDKISQNAPLVTIRSSEVSDVQNDRLSAKANLAQAKHLHDMNKELFKLGAVTANDLAASQSNLQQAEALLNGFSQKLNYFGASSGQTLTLRAPINGVVYEIGTHLGEKVANDAAQPLIKIANPHKKMVVAAVYEKDISAFFVGKEVDITIENREVGPIKGTVTYVSDVLDPENKTTQVYIKPSVDSPDLRINMFANISTGAEQKEVFRIPKKSLLFKEGKFIVFIKKGDQFSPLNVTLISDDPQDNFSLVKGLPQNSQIALEAITLEKQ
ncbi:MAG: efflux RND transporter periplasmic adaptor subunit [Sulfuricurvum sp.]|jgi:cobalt-zinc-cadmium efflux system membrane fusion protein|uniref:efflux RND transporter periplasmic adaptor subunit n=1 Tax=Sulfuricurvum sp. TaxID=2025608 RepID=UPI0025F50A92|nr:efflux RND transporter periplasmic adaptor subunit [Sulfuricurvum sp.]MCK9371825.1 efflux RND transporter periplasmic adaptor subunit [Sulfuricurvum sp.]